MRWSLADAAKLRGAALAGPLGLPALVLMAASLGRSVAATRGYASRLGLPLERPRPGRRAAPKPPAVDLHAERRAVERELQRRPQARAPRTTPYLAAPERVRVEREAPIIDDGRFAAALARATAAGREIPPALPTRLAPPVERVR